MEKEMTEQFKFIYESLNDAIFRFCLSRVSDREIALDLTQEIFTRLWQSLQSGKIMKNSRSFVFTIAHNLIVDWYRKKKSFSLDSIQSNLDEDNYSFEPEGESKSQVEMSAEGRFVLSAISKLSNSYRQAVYLYFVEGLPREEIAEIMNITDGAASVRITRGIAELRKITGYDIN